MNEPRVSSVPALLRAGLLAALGSACLPAQVPEPAPAGAATEPADQSEAPEPVTAEAKAKEPAKLEPFEVAGSHVKRLDCKMPSPVVTYAAEAIAATGDATFGERIK